MIPFSEIISRTRTRFEQESSARWSDTAIGQAVNEGLDELSERTGFYERYISIPLIEGRTFYDMRGYPMDDSFGVTAMWGTVRQDWLTPISEEDLESRWEEAVGDPHSYFTRGASWVGIYPKPNSTVGYIRVFYAGLAPQFTTGQSVLADLPDDFIPALEDYALYELNAQDGETKKALLHWKDFSNRADQLKDFVEKRINTVRVGKLGALR